VADFSFEKKFLESGHRSVAGVDEVGRGCLFGPVVAAAVVFPPRIYVGAAPEWMADIDDSKRVRPAERERLAGLILREADMASVGLATSREIDALNILQAVRLAVLRAVASLPRTPDILLVDGFPLRDVKYHHMGICGGDRLSVSIAAASLVAKVFRDGLMRKMDPLFDGYGIARNKGYGTPQHFRALENAGPTPLHRRSFFLGPNPAGAGAATIMSVKRESGRS
jgi:ribonuclease HII